MHLCRTRAMLARRQDGLDARHQPVARGRVDDAVGFDAGGMRLAHEVIGAVQQVFEARHTAAGSTREARRETALQRMARARDADRHIAVAPAVPRHQTVRTFFEEAAALLDGQHVAGRIHDDEIDVAVDREALIETRPVHAVIDRIGRRQRAFEQGERGAFALGRCTRVARIELPPAIGYHLCHFTDPVSKWARAYTAARQVCSSARGYPQDLWTKCVMTR